MTSVPTAMTIAGSDSGAGAGIQADLKTFAAMGVYGTSALTAITAQNTEGVTDIFELPTSIIASQIDAIVTDIGANAVKTGMLSSSAVIECVVEKLQEYDLTRLVVDPVMVAQAGDRLLQEGGGPRYADAADSHGTAGNSQPVGGRGSGRPSRSRPRKCPEGRE